MRAAIGARIFLWMMLARVFWWSTLSLKNLKLSSQVKKYCQAKRLPDEHPDAHGNVSKPFHSSTLWAQAIGGMLSFSSSPQPPSQTPAQTCVCEVSAQTYFHAIINLALQVRLNVLRLTPPCPSFSIARPLTG